MRSGKKADGKHDVPVWSVHVVSECRDTALLFTTRANTEGGEEEEGATLAAVVELFVR